jgi:hypothetical protein
MIVVADFVKRRQISPFIIKQPLKLDASLVDRRSGRVESEAVANHELEIVVKFLSVWVFPVIKLLSHRR